MAFNFDLAAKVAGIALAAITLYSVTCEADFVTSSEVKSEIASEYGISYDSKHELNKRVQFYRYDPTYYGDLEGYRYVVDGVEYNGNNREINALIDRYCDQLG